SFEGIFSNHNGIGSRVEIYGDWGIQVREVRSGTSFSPMKSLNAHFGLGQATSVDSVVVKWPSGVVTTIPNPQINAINHIPESNCILASTPITVEGGIAQICAGSSVTLTAAAGFDQYLWNNGAQTQSIEVSSGGIYSASLTDADGCISVSEQVFIVELPEDNITLSTLGDLQFCEGGSVMISASYGTNFEWSNGATTQTIEATVSGIYYVEAMGACSETISDSIIVNVVPAPAPMVEDVLLNEPGTATISATGESILWYETEDATEPIGSGNVFETPFITESVQFWAEATYQYGGQLETGGKVDNSGGGGIPS